MFGALTDGMRDDTRLRRVFITQQDFLKKLIIAFGLIYVSYDAQSQILMILIPRLLILFSQLVLKIFENRLIIFKEVVTEALLMGVLVVVLVLDQGDFVNNLNDKINLGWCLEFLVLAIILFNAISNTYLVSMHIIIDRYGDFSKIWKHHTPNR